MNETCINFFFIVKMKLYVIFIILTIFLLIITNLNQNKSNEHFSEFTKEELQVVKQPFNSKHNRVYMSILKKYDLPISPLDKQNYCDVLGIFGKKCDLKLTYTNK